MKEDLLEKIRSKKAIIAVIGLGYVGEPLANAFSNAGFAVIGVDTDYKKVEASSVLATTKLESMGVVNIDCIIICVPTPLTKNKEPDLSYVTDVATQINKHIHPGTLVVLESTTYPGTTEEILLPAFKKFFSFKWQVGVDYFVGYSPEREDPGNSAYDVTNIPKIVSGTTPSCLEVVSALYSNITEVVEVSSTKTAEFAKILENTYRCINIAFVNELKLLAHKMDIDIFEVIDATATKPFGYQAFYPGPGLGGHCIPIDPFYLSWKAKEYGFSARFIELAGEINTSMPEYIVKKIAEILNKHQQCISGSSILILGIAYKKDVADIRESPGVAIIKLLQKQGANVYYNDPWVPELKLEGYDLHMQSLDLGKIGSMDATIIITDHSGYNYEDIVQWSDIVIDTRNATKGVKDKAGKVYHA